MPKHLLWLFTTLLPLCAQTSSLTGLVQDPMGASIANAQVTVVAGSSISKTASSGSDGRYRVEGLADGPATLTVEAAGFRKFSKTLQISGATTADVSVELGTLSESVLVTASGGTAISLEEAGISASVFTAEDFKLRQPSKVAELLREVPGLNIVQTGSNGGITNIFLRGGDSNSALVMLDGVPISDPGGELNMAGVSASALDRMEVVRGPQSSLYGAEAASGVIQMFTKHGDPETARPHTELLYERGSFSTDHWSANLNGGFAQKGDYSLTTDQFRSTGQFPNNVFRNITGTGSLGYRFTNNTNARAVYREFDSYTGAPAATAFTAYNLDANQRDRDSLVGLKLEDSRNDWFSQRVNFGYHRQRRRYQDLISESYPLTALVQDRGPGAVFFVRLVPQGTTVADPGTRIATQTITNFTSTSLNITDRTQAGYQATMTHKGGTFVAGYDFERQSGLITNNNVDRRNNGISLFEQYAWRQRIFFSAGARIEHSNIFGYRFAPRGAVTFKLPTDTFLRFSLGRGIKQPTLLESFAQASTYFGNPSLRPAKTDSFEAGLERRWFNNRVQTEVTYFRNNYSDLIQFVSDPVTFIGTWQNIARSRSRGLEVTGSARITSIFKITAGYTRLNSRILVSGTTSDIGLALPRRPQNSGTVALEFAKKRVSGVIGSRFVGNSRNTFAPFGINRISAYNVAYLTVNYQASKNVQLFLRINNLNNEQYQEVNGYGAWSRNALGGVRLNY